MLKKIGILLEIFSTLSLLGVGFASWEISQDRVINIENGELIVDQVFDVSDVGISYVSNSAQGFTYYQEIDPNTSEVTNYFDRTTLSFSIYLNRNVLENFDYDNPQIYYLEIKVFYISSTIDLFTETTFITAPSQLKCALKNIESQFILTNLVANKKNYGADQFIYSLTANVPLKVTDAPCLYNLAIFDIKSTSGSVPIDILFEFTNPTERLTNTYFTDVCDLSYHYSLSIQAK